MSEIEEIKSAALSAIEAASEERFVPPDDELTRERQRDQELQSEGSEHAPRKPLRTPRRWERLLGQASVIGGKDRWERRLTALYR